MTPGQEPHAGIEQHHGRDLAAREHVIADRDFFEAARLRSPARPRPRTVRRPGRRPARRQLRDPLLGQWPAARRHQKARAIVSRTAPTASIARASTSAFITMPAPPPAGVSSTCDACRARARGYRAPRATRCPPPAPSGKAHAERTRKHVRKDREHGGAPHGSFFSFGRAGISRRQLDRRSCRRAISTSGTVASVKAAAPCRAVRQLQFDHIAGAEIVHGDHLAERLAGSARQR